MLGPDMHCIGVYCYAREIGYVPLLPHYAVGGSIFCGGTVVNHDITYIKNFPRIKNVLWVQGGLNSFHHQHAAFTHLKTKVLLFAYTNACSSHTHNVRTVSRVLIMIAVVFMISIMNMIITWKIHSVNNALIMIQWVIHCVRMSVCDTHSGITV